MVSFIVIVAIIIIVVSDLIYICISFSHFLMNRTVAGSSVSKKPPVNTSGKQRSGPVMLLVRMLNRRSRVNLGCMERSRLSWTTLQYYTSK